MAKKIRFKGKSEPSSIGSTPATKDLPVKNQPTAEVEEEKEDFDQEGREFSFPQAETPAPQKNTNVPNTKQVVDKARAAAKAAKTYDETLAYTGVVIDIKEVRGGKTLLYIIDGPHGPVQVYDSSLSKPTLSKMGLQAEVQFTPVRNEGSNGEPYYTGVDVTVKEVSKGAEFYAQAVKAYAEGAVMIPEQDAIKALSHAKDYESGMAALAGKYGDIIAAVPKAFQGPGLVAWKTSKD